MNILRVVKEIFMDKEGNSIPSFLPKNLTEHYKKEITNCFLDEVYIATEYKQIDEILTLYKYHSHREYDTIFQNLYLSLIAFIKTDKFSDITLVPVPMHWSRYVSRGFNHIDRLVKNMAQQGRFSYKNILSISFFHITFYQSKLSREERLENKKNTVRIKGQFTPEGTIFLFDDVISTGATANDCARILKYRGAKKVVGIFLASNIS